MQMAGVPDLLVVHRSWSGFLELKVGTNKLSGIQRKVMKDITARNFPCYVLRWNGIVTLEALSGEVWEVKINTLIKDLIDVGEQEAV